MPGVKKIGEGVRGEGCTRERPHCVWCTNGTLDSGCQETPKSRQADVGARVWQVQGEVVVCKQSVGVPAPSEDSR